MTNFEKITASPDALGEFLASLPVATGPWDEEFHRAFCVDCERENCDEKRCPHQDKRNNPTWWLTMGGKPGEVPGLSINIKAALPLEWGKEYYTVDSTVKQVRAACVCCDNTGKVTIKGTEYESPRCNGNWRDKEIVGQKTVYSVAKWKLTSITVTPHGQDACFERLNGKTTGGWNNIMRVQSSEFKDMIHRGLGRGGEVKIYDDYKSAMDQVKMLNAAEREKQAKNNA
jgi:hypothetical protein